MEWLSSVLMAVQVISSLSIIVLVLLQQGKGSEMGAAFGSGSAGSLFGSSGAANFLSRTTKWAAIVFFASTAGLAYVAHHPAATVQEPGGVMQGFDPSVPALPGAGNAVPSVPNTGTAVPSASGSNTVPSVPASPSVVPSAPSSVNGTQDSAQTAPTAASNATPASSIQSGEQSSATPDPAAEPASGTSASTTAN